MQAARRYQCDGIMSLPKSLPYKVLIKQPASWLCRNRDQPLSLSGHCIQGSPVLLANSSNSDSPSQGSFSQVGNKHSSIYKNVQGTSKENYPRGKRLKSIHTYTEDWREFKITGQAKWEDRGTWQFLSRNTHSRVNEEWAYMPKIPKTRARFSLRKKKVEFLAEQLKF